MCLRNSINPWPAVLESIMKAKLVDLSVKHMMEENKMLK